MTLGELLHKAVDQKPSVIAVLFAIASAVSTYIYWTGRNRSRGMKGRLLSQEELEKAKWECVGKISKVWLYPVKSCTAISLKSAQACPLGLRDGNMRDRSFAFTTEKGGLIKGNMIPGTVRIKPVVKDRLLILQHPLEEDLEVDLDQVEAEKKEASINIYGDIAPGYDCGEAASQWLTKVLGKKAHLLYHSTIPSPRRTEKLVGQHPLAKDNDNSLYADAFPFMLMTKASIADLQSRVSCPTPPENFRPNLLVEGSAKAYDEDDWAYIKIGDAVFRHVVPCGRCTFTTVNHETGVKEANMEPLRTLRKYRPSTKNNPFFGISLALETMGTVREEDEVYVTRFSKMYLGSGCSMADLHYSHKIGYSTVQSIIKEVCSQIWNVLLNECMPKPSQENWLRICTDFEKNAHFPNCLGAVDGKHIRIIKPSDSGSLYYNYKKFFSLVLLAVCDADYCFTYIDVGSYGKESDSNIFKNSDFYQLLESNNLNIPESATVEDQRGQIPYVFVADEAFSLSQQILRPYSGNQLTEIKKIFNYRLCRARRYIECTFGILANKWRIFHRPLNVSVELAEIITRACCILHNFVRKRDGHRYHDSANNPNDKTGLGNILSAENVQGGRNANKIRDSFASYFVTEEGALPWQYEKM